MLKATRLVIQSHFKFKCFCDQTELNFETNTCWLQLNPLVVCFAQQCTFTSRTARLSLKIKQSKKGSGKKVVRIFAFSQTFPFL